MATPKYKMALLTWSGAWALITLILWVLGPATASWPLPLRTLLISVLMVLGLTWVLIPLLTRTFAGWLSPGLRGRSSSRGVPASSRAFRAGAAQPRGGQA